MNTATVMQIKRMAEDEKRIKSKYAAVFDSRITRILPKKSMVICINTIKPVDTMNFSPTISLSDKGRDFTYLFRPELYSFEKSP